MSFGLLSNPHMLVSMAAFLISNMVHHYLLSDLSLIQKLTKNEMAR